MSTSSGSVTRLTPIAFLLILVGAGLAALGLKFDGPFIGAAVATFGAVAILGGVHSIVTRTHRTDQGLRSPGTAREHSGLAAVLLGVAFILPGLVLVVAGLASALGMADGLVAGASERPGAIIMGAGAWACLVGTANLVSRWKYVWVSTTWWQRLPGQAVGVLVIAMGVGLIAVGRTLSLDPGNPREALGRIAERIAQLLAGGG